MYRFCTYFDSNYLVRFLPMYTSLMKHCRSDSIIYALALDNLAEDILARLKLPKVYPLNLSQVESWEPRLLTAKGNRTRIEYYFTLTPAIVCFLLEQNPDCNSVTYIDSDLFFFSPLSPLFEEIGSASVAIPPHRFPPRLKHGELVGQYNVAFEYFCNDKYGRDCAKFWFEQCLEWCYDRVEGDKYADQRYLDAWPTLFQGVHVISHIGADLAPWNLENYKLSMKGDVPYVDESPVIFFHYQGFRRLSPTLVDTGLGPYGQPCTRESLKYLCTPYMRSLSEAEKILSPFGFSSGSTGNTRSALVHINVPWRNILRGLFHAHFMLWVRGRLVSLRSPLAALILENIGRFARHLSRSGTHKGVKEPY